MGAESAPHPPQRGAFGQMPQRGSNLSVCHPTGWYELAFSVYQKYRDLQVDYVDELWARAKTLTAHRSVVLSGSVRDCFTDTKLVLFLTRISTPPRFTRPPTLLPSACLETAVTWYPGTDTAPPAS